MQRVNCSELEIDYAYGDLYLWHGQPFTGIGYDLRPDGSLWSEIKYVNGREHGIARDWHPSGQLDSETTYFNGSYFGPDREWDENGQLRSETIFEYGFPLHERKWDADGRLLSEKRMEPGTPYHDRLEEQRRRYQVDPHRGVINGVKRLPSLAEMGDDWL